MFKKWIMAGGLIIALATLALAAVPQTITYQGYLKNTDGTPVDVATNVKFVLYSSTSGAGSVWNSATVSVTPANGIYSVEIGPIDLPFDRPYWLGVTAGSDPEMRPLQALTSTPYAFSAKVAETVIGNSIGTAAITDNSVTTAKIADGAVTDAKITGPISGNKLGSHAHNGEDISSGTVGIANGGTGSSNGSITGTGALTLAAGGVDTNVTLVPNGAGTVDVSSKRVTSVAAPTASTDAATKQYVDTTAAAVVPAGFMIMGTSVAPPPGYTYTGTTSVDMWTTKTAMPTARAFHAAAAVNNVIYVMGGSNSHGSRATNEAYDPATNSWTAKADMPTARYGLAAVAVNNVIYSIGGFENDYLATNEAYDPTTDSWTTKTAMPTARHYHAAVAVDNVIYAIGGFKSGYLTANEAYDPATNSWTTKAAMPTARAYLAAAAANNVIYAIGGYYGVNYLTTNEAYDPATNSWSTKAAMPTSRYFLAAAAVNNVVYAIGGLGTSTLATNEAYDPAADSWSTKTAMPTARYLPAVAAINNVIYVIGGYNDNNGSYLTTNEAYDPARKLYIFTKD